MCICAEERKQHEGNVSPLLISFLMSVFVMVLWHFSCLILNLWGCDRDLHSKLCENLLDHTHKTQTAESRRPREGCWLYQHCLLITLPSYFPMTYWKLTECTLNISSSNFPLSVRPATGSYTKPLTDTFQHVTHTALMLQNVHHCTTVNSRLKLISRTEKKGEMRRSLQLNLASGNVAVGDHSSAATLTEKQYCGTMSGS